LFLSINRLIYCESLAVGHDGAIYVGGHSGYIHAVNSDGTKKWKRFFPVTLPEEETIDEIPVSVRDAIPKGFDLETMPPMICHPMMAQFMPTPTSSIML